MLYTAAISTPASTTEASPQRTEIKTAGGILYHASILFPQGVNALTHLTLSHGGHQFLPSTKKMDLTGDGETVTVNCYEVLTAAKNWITATTWNDDDTYAHTLYLRIAVEREDVLAFGTIQSRIPDLVRKVLKARDVKSGVTGA